MNRTVMRHLIDAREPITITDIETAIRESGDLLEAYQAHGLEAIDPVDVFNALERLLAIVSHTYGYEKAGTDD